MTNEQALKICQERKDNSEAPEWKERECYDNDDEDWPELPKERTI